MTLPDDIVELAGACNIAHLATVCADGSPHSVPLWIGIEAGQLAFLSDPHSQKARNLERDPRLAISIIDLAEPTRMAMVRGSVTRVVDGAAGWDIIDRIATKYTGGPYPLRRARVAYLVRADHVTATSFG